MQVRHIFTQSRAFNAGTSNLHAVTCVECRYVKSSRSHVRLMQVRQIFTQSRVFNAGTLYLHAVTCVNAGTSNLHTVVCVNAGTEERRKEKFYLTTIQHIFFTVK